MAETYDPYSQETSCPAPALTAAQFVEFLRALADEEVPISGDEGLLTFGNIILRKYSCYGAGRDTLVTTDALFGIYHQHLAGILRNTKGKIYGADGAARLLGLKPSTLQAKLKKYGLQRKEFSGGA